MDATPTASAPTTASPTPARTKPRRVMAAPRCSGRSRHRPAGRSVRCPGASRRAGRRTHPRPPGTPRTADRTSARRRPHRAADHDHAAGLELWIGHVDAVLAHALREGQHRVALLLGDVARRAEAGRHQVLAGLLCLLDLRAVELAGSGADRERHLAVRADLRIGHVDAVLAHALGEGEGRILGIDRRLGLGRRRRCGRLAAEAGHAGRVGRPPGARGERRDRHEGERERNDSIHGW